jgi:hypothetical protein
MSTTATVFDRYLEHCQPYRPSGPWHGLAADVDCFACPQYGTAVLARLADEFTEPELIASGIALKLPDGLVMQAALVGASYSVIALRSTAEAPPFALLTSSGVLTSSEVLSPASELPLAVLEDGHTRTLLRDSAAQLLVAFDLPTVLTLRSLGWPATAADGLAEPTSDNLAHIESRCGWLADAGLANAALPPWPPETGRPQPEVMAADASSITEEDRNPPPPLGAPDPSVLDLGPIAARTDGEEAPLLERAGEEFLATHRDDATMTKQRPPLDVWAAPLPVTLVVVGWSVATMSLEQPRELRPLVDGLLQAARCLDFDCSRIAVWLPTAEDLERIQFCLDAQSFSAAAKAAEASLATNLFALDALPGAPDDASRSSGGYLTAQRRHAACLASHGADSCTAGCYSSGSGAPGSHATALREAEALLHTAIERELVEPLVLRALGQEDPMDRNMGIVAAHLARHVHHLAIPPAGLALDMMTSGTDVDRWHKQTALFLKTTSALLGVARELRR